MTHLGPSGPKRFYIRHVCLKSNTPEGTGNELWRKKEWELVGHFQSHLRIVQRIEGLKSNIYINTFFFALYRPTLVHTVG